MYCIFVECWHDNLYSLVSEIMYVTEIMYSWLYVLYLLKFDTTLCIVVLYPYGAIILPAGLWNNFLMCLV